MTVLRRATRVLPPVAGGLLVVLGLTLPPSDLVRMLDAAAEPRRWRQLWLGAWILKTLLCVHGAWLLAATSRSARGGGAAVAGDRPSPLWEPITDWTAAGHGRKESVLVVGLLLVAAILRSFGLGLDLWHDEVFALVDFARPAFSEILSTYESDNQHLLYSLFAHASIIVFGENAATVRLPALLLGLASLWATLRLARLIAPPVEGRFAVALLVFSYHHIWFSQNARGYTGLLLTTVLSTELFLRGLWKDGWPAWLAYAAVAAAGMGFHPTMIFVVAAHAAVLAWLAIRQREPVSRCRRAAAALVLTGTLTAQLYALVLPQVAVFYLQPAAGAMTQEVEWKNPLWFVNETLRGLGFGLAFGWIGLLGAASVFTAGLLSFLSRSQVLAMCFVLPGLLGGVTLLLLDRNLWPRFFFNLFAFAALIAIRGAFAVATRARRWLPRARLGPVLASLLVLASAAMVPRIYRYPKQDYSGAREFVLENRSAGDRVVAVGLAAEAYAAYYDPEMATALTLDELMEREARVERTWVLYTLPQHMMATQPALWRYLSTEYELVRRLPGTLNGGALVVLLREQETEQRVGEPDG